MPSSTSSTFVSCVGLLLSQYFWGAKRMREPLAPPRMSEPRKVEADAHATETNSETVSPESKIFAFRAATPEASTKS